MPKALFVPLQLSFGTFACLSASPLLAQVTSDGTVNTQVNQNGNVAEVTGGETRNGNLFHSFQDFSVPTNNRAFFNNANDISNIFSRVTGGNISTIDGVIQANGSASLFLINPAGILFGENASLDLGGSFYGSTADSILFEGGEFSAVDNLEQPLLTVNAPIGLGFRDNPGDITNNSIANDGNGLEVNTGQNLTLLGGNITFNGGNILAPGGRVELGGLAGEGVIRFDKNGSLDFSEDATKGNVSLAQGAVIDVTASNGGFITINANNLEILNGSAIIAGIGEGLGSPQSQAGDITLNVSDTLTLQADENTSSSRIVNLLNIEGVGNAGDINIDTTTLEGNGNFSIGSAAVGQGNAGQVIVNASEKVSFVGLEGFSSGIASLFASTTPGNSNDIVINTSSLSLSNGTQVATSAVGQGNAGNIIVNASESISLSGDSNLQAQTFGQGNSGNISISTANLSLLEGSEVTASTFGEGNAGAVNITATGDITADGEDLEGFQSGITSLVNSGAVGDSGGVTISANNLILTNGGRVSAGTFSTGNAGAVNITATGDITADGENSGGFASGVYSTVSETAVGNSGGINITTNDLTLTQGSVVNGSTFGEGDAGAVTINASGTISADGENSGGFASGVYSTVSETAVGNSGGINITTNDLTLTQGSVVNGSTFGEGNAGVVSIDAAGTISADGEDSDGSVSGVFSTVGETAVGNSGGINITTTDLTLTQGGEVSASTFGEGNAGAVTINASGTISADGEDSDGSVSGVFSTVGETAVGNSGGINITTTDLTLTQGGEVSASTFGEGNAGAVTINASGTISADGENSGGFTSGVYSTVGETAVGNSGGIEITTNDLILTNGSQIITSTFSQGNAGLVKINASGTISADGEDSDGDISGVFSTVLESAVGNSSGIEIITTDISLTEGGVVNASTFGEGDAGAVSIDAAGTIFADGENASCRCNSGIFSEVAETGKGNAAGIDINANNLFFSNNAEISVSSLGEGNASDLTINTNSLALNNGASLSATTPVGIGGSINLDIADRLTLSENSTISAQAFNNANGGNVDINSKFVIASPNQNSDIIASAENGIGGRISITADGVFGLVERESNPPNETNDLDATSGVGLDGEVTITILETNLFQDVIDTPNIVAPEQTVAQACQANRIATATGGLTIEGKGGVPPEPGLPLSSSEITVDGERNTTSNIPQPIETSQGQIQPARGIKVTESGGIILTAYRTNNAGERLPEIKQSCG